GDAAFAAALEPPQRAAVDEHLRNRNYVLCWGREKVIRDPLFGSDPDHDDIVRIVGIGGRPEKGHASYNGAIEAATGKIIPGVQTEGISPSGK
ncbi:MAG: hypothetical protein HY293_10295, partial [Planctomycetes bacterium]|nr:hypothetical protein [Planctomycetota bacterium]